MGKKKKHSKMSDKFYESLGHLYLSDPELFEYMYTKVYMPVKNFKDKTVKVIHLPSNMDEVSFNDKEFPLDSAKSNDNYFPISDNIEVLYEMEARQKDPVYEYEVAYQKWEQDGYTDKYSGYRTYSSTGRRKIGEDEDGDPIYETYANPAYYEWKNKTDWVLTHDDASADLFGTTRNESYTGDGRHLEYEYRGAYINDKNKLVFGDWVSNIEDIDITNTPYFGFSGSVRSDYVYYEIKDKVLS